MTRHGRVLVTTRQQSPRITLSSCPSLPPALQLKQQPSCSCTPSPPPLSVYTQALHKSPQLTELNAIQGYQREYICSRQRVIKQYYVSDTNNMNDRKRREKMTKRRNIHSQIPEKSCNRSPTQRRKAHALPFVHESKQ